MSFFCSYRLSEYQINIPQKKQRRYAEIKATLEVNSDGKCYCPCNSCRGLRTRRILQTSAEKHCKEKGHAEGGYEYHPLVRRCSLHIVHIVIVLIVYSHIFFIILNICVVYYTLMLLHCL